MSEHLSLKNKEYYRGKKSTPVMGSKDNYFAFEESWNKRMNHGFFYFKGEENLMLGLLCKLPVLL